MKSIIFIVFSCNLFGLYAQEKRLVTHYHFHYDTLKIEKKLIESNSDLGRMYINEWNSKADSCLELYKDKIYSLDLEIEHFPKNSVLNRLNSNITEISIYNWKGNKDKKTEIDWVFQNKNLEVLFLRFVKYDEIDLSSFINLKSFTLLDSDIKKLILPEQYVKLTVIYSGPFILDK